MSRVVPPTPKTMYKHGIYVFVVVLIHLTSQISFYSELFWEWGAHKNLLIVIETKYMIQENYMCASNYLQFEDMYHI